jgi:hypothetical protein
VADNNIGETAAISRVDDTPFAPIPSSLLSFRNDDVLDAFCESLNVTRDEAEGVFREFIKFIWLAESTPHSKLAIDHPILIIDEMWHTFILFTKEYSEFCRSHFGHYIHHVPTTATEKARARLERRAWTPEKRQQVIAEKRERYSFIYDALGKETFIKWYYEYPEKYSQEKILELRRK